MMDLMQVQDPKSIQVSQEYSERGFEILLNNEYGFKCIGNNKYVVPENILDALKNEGIKFKELF